MKEGKIMTTKETIKPKVEEIPAFEAFLVQLRKQFDIVELMSQHRELQREGDHYICACPVHPDNKNTCRVSPDTQGFYSFGCCGAGGDCIEYARLMNNMSYVEAAYFLAQLAEIDEPQDECVEDEI
jgi:DNA primase